MWSPAAAVQKALLQQQQQLQEGQQVWQESKAGKGCRWMRTLAVPTKRRPHPLTWQSPLVLQQPPLLTWQLLPLLMWQRLPLLTRLQEKLLLTQWKRRLWRILDPSSRPSSHKALAQHPSTHQPRLWTHQCQTRQQGRTL